VSEQKEAMDATDQSLGQSDGSGLEAMVFEYDLKTARRERRRGAIRLERVELPKLMCAGTIV
jgi:hypothetical protein